VSEETKQTTSNKNLGKTLGLITVALGLISFVVLVLNDKASETLVKVRSKKPSTTQTQTAASNSKNRLTTLWAQDFEKMNEGSFTEEFSQVKNIKVFMLDKNLHFLLDQLSAPISINQTAPYSLEVSFISHYSEELEKDILIIQYNFIDTATTNMVLELSRQLVLSDSFLKE